MEGLISKFGKDSFILSRTATPDIIISTGYEKHVYINGICLSELASGASQKKSDVVYLERGVSGTVFMYNAYTENPSGSGGRYIPVDSTEYIFRSNTTRPTQPGNYRDSSLFIAESIPPFISYINEYRFYSTTSAFTLYQTSEGTYIFHVHIDCDEPFGISIQTGPNSGSQESYYTINYQPESKDELEYDKATKMLDNNTSYELLRVNPKLTGNVKVVVDSNQDIYMDTFKVSKGLSQRKYRKISLNPDEYYGRTVMRKMSGMPSTDFYKIEDSCYSIFSLANNLGDQYYDIYNSGARTNYDKMYGENYSILAPLCIKKNMPDFFVVFKISGYEELSTNREKISKFLSDGEIVKVFDLRENSNAGKLIRKVYENSKDFVGDLYVSYNYDQNNVYNGISIDRGVVSQIYESASLCRNIKNQVAMNDWFTLGFERNRIVSKNILNFEFMFDDTSEDLFSVNTYFGLYIKLNGEKEDFNCIGFDGNDKPIFNEEIHGESFNPSASGYRDLIYGFTSPDGFIRLSSNITSQSNKEILEKYAKTPYQGIASPSAVNTDESVMDKCYSFIKFNDRVTPGEHFRVIDMTGKKIYEIIISNFKNEEFDISEINYYKETIAGEEFSIQRVSVYGIPYREDCEKVDMTKDREIDLIVEAFNSFGEDEIMAYKNDDNVCIIYNSTFEYGTHSVYMEKVTSFSEMGESRTSKNSISYDDESAYLLGQKLQCQIKTNATSSDRLENILYPVGFESLGTRLVYACSFIPFNLENGKKLFHIGSNIDISLTKEKTVIYKTEKGYDFTEKFNIYLLGKDGSFVEYPVQSIPGFGGNGTRLIEVGEDPDIIDGDILLYNLHPLNAGLFSILQVKDINTDILDSVNKISTQNSDYISGVSGEFNSKDNVFEKNLLPPQDPEESVMNYMDKYERFTSYKNSDGKEIEIVQLEPINLTGYLTTMNSANHKHSDISLTYPYCCKWKIVGTDSRGENMRVMFKYSIDSSNKSYFIPENNDFYIGNITASKEGNESPIDAYDSCTHGYPKYLNSKFDPREHRGFRKYLFEGNGSVDELLINDGGKSAKMSSVYENGNDAIEFIAGGLKIYIQLKNSSFLDIRKYAGYSAILVCSSGNNPNNLNPCEILFDEINEQISIFVYNGSAPCNMFYNEYNAKKTIDGSIRIPSIYPTFHKTSMSECRTSFIDSSKVSLINDDGSIWRLDGAPQGFAQMISPIESEDGFVFVSSNIVDRNSFSKEKYSLLTGRFTPLSMNRKFNPDYIAAFDSILFVDSSRMEPYYSQFKRCNNMFNDNVDMFIMSNLRDGIADAYKFELATDYATLPLWKVKEFMKNPMVYVKTENGTYDYSNLNGMFNIEVKDPVDIYVENSDFEVIDHGTAHPSYAEPVTRDIFEFSNRIDELNSIFKMSLDGCNLRINDVGLIPQIILRKVSDKPLTTDNRKTVTNTYDIKVTLFEIHPKVPAEGIDLLSGDYIIDTGTNDTYCVTDDSSLMKEYTTTTFIAHSAPDSSLSFDSSTGDTFPGDTVIINNKEYQINSVIDSSIEEIDTGTVDDQNRRFRYGRIEFTIMTYPGIEAPYGTRIQGTNGKSSFDTEASSIKNITYGQFLARSVGGAYAPESGRLISFNLYQQGSSPYYFDASALTSYDDTYTETIKSGSIVSTTGISVLHNMNPMVDCWNSSIYRSFTDFDTFSEDNGIGSGYEKNVFFSSHGINLKSEDENGEIKNSIEITKWVNTIIDKKNHSIKLNVTDSLIKHIMYSDGYMKNWIDKVVEDPQSKQRYIENSILKYINIDSDCPIEIKISPSKSIEFANEEKKSDNFIPLKGINRKLYTEKGKYYLVLENVKDYKYMVKMKIYL